MHSIGIDIGTTSICGVLVDTDSGKVLKVVSKNSDSFIKTKNGYEKIQSVDKIIGIAKDILHSLITDSTCVIGVTGQMHGIVYTDIDGKAVSPLYTWQDGRGGLIYKDGLTYAQYLGSCVGYGNVTDFYNKENDLRPKSSVSYCTIQDYLVMVLCGLKSPIVHITNASSFGKYDLKEKKFDYDCQIRVTDGYTVAGEYNGIPVAVAIGDNQASVLSCVTEKDVLINVGTGSQISVISDKVVVGENIETRPYFEGKYLIVGAALCGGRAYAVLKDFYKKILSYSGDVTDEVVYAFMEKTAERSDSSPLCVDTRFSGTRACPEIKGSISGISCGNFTPENLTVGVIEGIIDELMGMYMLFGIAKDGLVGSGNGIRKNKRLINIAEQRLGTKMKIPKNTEEAAVGAAVFACLATGICKDMKQASDRFFEYC